jgi:hypothetical protein
VERSTRLKIIVESVEVFSESVALSDSEVCLCVAVFGFNAKGLYNQRAERGASQPHLFNLQLMEKLKKGVVKNGTNSMTSYNTYQGSNVPQRRYEVSLVRKFMTHSVIGEVRTEL